MSVVVVVAPTEGLDLDLVKRHLREESGDNDDLIEAYIAAAFSHVDGPDGWLGRSLRPQTLELRQAHLNGSVRLPFGPVTGVLSVKYVGTDGVEQTLPAEQYELTADGILCSAYGLNFPTPRGDAEGVRIRYTAGYATLPTAVQQALLLLIGHWFANRETVNVGNLVSEMPMATQALLAPFRSWAV